MTDSQPQNFVNYSTTGNVLVVDDTPENLRLLSNLLSQAGHKVRKVTDGKWAIQAALLSPPDLILLDIVMPEMSGYEVCRLLKEMDRTREIPVIFLSVNDEPLDKVQAFRFGGIDYITKPFEPAEVLVRVETQLKIRQLQKQVQEQNLRLQSQNLQLQQEIHDRHSAESALATLNQEIEDKIYQQTNELEQHHQEWRDRQTELEQALAQERHASQARMQLMSALMQTCRSTLSTIAADMRVWADQLHSSKPEADRSLNDSLQQTIHSIDQLQQTLEDVFLLEQLDSSTLVLAPEPIELTHLCSLLVENWSLSISSRHSLHFRTTGEAPPFIQLDCGLLKRMLIHLLENAIYYSPAGGRIQLELIYQPISVSFQIQDQGIGIPAAEQQSVCNRFYRASNAGLIPGPPRAGLGLAIVKQFVELHTGTITITSEEHQGTTVTVSLPLAAASAPEEI